MNLRQGAEFYSTDCGNGLRAELPDPNVVRGKTKSLSIWQAISTAYWDLEDQPAQAGALIQIGAIGAIPAVYGVIDGGTVRTSLRRWLRGRKTSSIA
jgi:hypothetical protein